MARVTVYLPDKVKAEYERLRLELYGPYVTEKGYARLIERPIQEEMERMRQEIARKEAASHAR